MPRLIALRFIALRRYCGFYKLKVCDNLSSSKSIGVIFQHNVLSSCLCVTFWQFLQYFKLFNYYYMRYGAL
jgi:hypothetical protein